MPQLEHVRRAENGKRAAHLLDHVGAELLHRKRADVPTELPDDRVAEPMVVQVQNVLHDLQIVAASVSETIHERSTDAEKKLT